MQGVCRQSVDRGAKLHVIRVPNPTFVAHFHLSSIPIRYVLLGRSG